MQKGSTLNNKYDQAFKQMLGHLLVVDQPFQIYIETKISLKKIF